MLRLNRAGRDVRYGELVTGYAETGWFVVGDWQKGGYSELMGSLS
jgi:hypothetical protein